MAMKENDWIWDGDSQEFFEEETGLYHRTCSFKKGRYINGQYRIKNSKI